MTCMYETHAVVLLAANGLIIIIWRMSFFLLTFFQLRSRSNARRPVFYGVFWTTIKRTLRLSELNIQQLNVKIWYNIVRNYIEYTTIKCRVMPETDYTATRTSINESTTFRYWLRHRSLYNKIRAKISGAEVLRFPNLRHRNYSGTVYYDGCRMT